MDKSDLNELKNMLSGLVEEIIDEKLDKITTKHEQKKEKKQKYRRRKQKEKESGSFDIDSLDLTAAEKKELAQASKSDKKNNVHLQRERMIKRRPSGRIEVRCRSCGKIEKVSPALVVKDEDGYRYKCNKCSCSPG
mgnify:FL=1|tara:strand:+ start:49 stop:456 length:408 start_codon:yes stop_codon:yes gene_type:complete